MVTEFVYLNPKYSFVLSCIQNFKIHQVPAAGGQRAGKSGHIMVMESVKSRLKTLSIKCQLQTIDDGQLIKTDSNFLYLHSNFPDCRTKSSETGPCCLTGQQGKCLGLLIIKHLTDFNIQPLSPKLLPSAPAPCTPL